MTPEEHLELIRSANPDVTKAIQRERSQQRPVRSVARQPIPRVDSRPMFGESPYPNQMPAQVAVRPRVRPAPFVQGYNTQGQRPQARNGMPLPVIDLSRQIPGGAEKWGPGGGSPGQPAQDYQARFAALQEQFPREVGANPISGQSDEEVFNEIANSEGQQLFNWLQEQGGPSGEPEPGSQVTTEEEALALMDMVNGKTASSPTRKKGSSPKKAVAKVEVTPEERIRAKDIINRVSRLMMEGAASGKPAAGNSEVAPGFLAMMKRGEDMEAKRRAERAADIDQRAATSELLSGYRSRVDSTNRAREEEAQRSAQIEGARIARGERLEKVLFEALREEMFPGKGKLSVDELLTLHEESKRLKESPDYVAMLQGR